MAPPCSWRYAARPAAARITTTRFIRLGPAPSSPRRPAVPNSRVPSKRSARSAGSPPASTSAMSLELGAGLLVGILGDPGAGRLEQASVIGGSWRHRRMSSTCSVAASRPSAQRIVGARRPDRRSAVRRGLRRPAGRRDAGASTSRAARAHRPRWDPGDAVLDRSSWKDYWVRTWGARGLLHVWHDSATAAIVDGSGRRALAARRDVPQGRDRHEVAGTGDGTARCRSEPPRVRRRLRASRSGRPEDVAASASGPRRTTPPYASAARAGDRLGCAGPGRGDPGGETRYAAPIASARRRRELSTRGRR